MAPEHSRLPEGAELFSPVTIERAHHLAPHDVADLQDFMPHGLPTIDREAMPEALESLMRAERAALLIARDAQDGTIVGAIVADAYGVDGLTGHIRQLVIAESQQGRGVGSQLLDSAITWLMDQGARVVQLHSAEHRVVARSLYASRGFLLDETDVFCLQVKAPFRSK